MSHALPGQTYPGGVAYDTIDAIYSKYHYNCPPDTAPAEGGSASGGDCLATWAHHPPACLNY
ncbi:MAG: hypothetical protein HY696_01985 [Deltaproteobacteria bacterium]|nr:hypothetical protein [Deltaproteobacteria bacterium]